MAGSAGMHTKRRTSTLCRESDRPRAWARGGVPRKGKRARRRMIDRQLIGRARAGDRHAADALAERLACIPSLVRICNRQLDRPLHEEQLGDVCQDVFAAVWAKLDDYDGVRDLEGWIYGFCFRQVRVTLRRSGREVGVEAGLESIEGGLDPDVEHVERGDLEGVEAAVHALEPPASTIVALKHFEDQSFAAIAERLDMPLGSVKTSYYRAVDTLRVRLGRLWRALQ